MPALYATDSTVTLTEKTERTLQEAILSGQLKPGGRLTIPMLSEQFGFGATPLREGLSRLVAQGLVTVSTNRGFRVAKVSFEDLRDITQSRLLVEQAALKLAFERNDEAWEDDIVTSTHRLLRIIRKSDSPYIESTAEYETAHKQFHRAIVSGCGLRRLMLVQSNLYDAADRYRRVMSDHRLTRNFLYDIHKTLADMVLAKKIDEALTSLERHIMTTLETVYAGH